MLGMKVRISAHSVSAIVGLALLVASVIGAARQPTANVAPAVSAAATGVSEESARRTLAAMPLVFEKNVGQAPGEIGFLARGGGFALGLSGVETTLSLRGKRDLPRRPRGIEGRHGDTERAGQSGKCRMANGKWQRANGDGEEHRQVRDSVVNSASATVKTRLIGANREAKSRGEKRLAAKIDYFRGDDPKQWHTDVPAYERVRTASVYPGIDVVHYGQQTGALEYDFVIAPGADPGDIRFAVEGAERVSRAENGDLVVHTPDGEIRQRKPVCYQEIGGVRVSVEGDFRLTSAPHTQEVSFRLAAYDRSRPLVIDPVLVYSTYLGGGGEDNGGRIAVDSSGRAYVTGSTSSTDFPTTAGDYQGDPGDGNYDAFVAVLDPAQSGASSLVYASYLGGGASDIGGAIVIDGNGRAYVTGSTRSTDFPTSAGKYQGDQGGTDTFVAVLDPAQSGASSLVFSTYLGGGLDDYSFGVAVDGSGRAYVRGATLSTDFPTTTGKFQGDPGDSDSDAFIAVVDPEQNGVAALVYSTYLGGSGGDAGWGGIAVDGSGRAYVTGWTGSTDFPTTAEKAQGDQGGTDAFVAVVDPTKSGVSSLIYATYLGGAGEDNGNGIAVDEGGRAYVTGRTGSTDFPITAGSFQVDPADSNWDAFVAVVDPARSGVATLVYSTYLGGGSADGGYGIAMDASGRAYVSGYTYSTDFPTTAGKYQGYPGDGDSNVFVTVLDLGLQSTDPTGLTATPVSSTRIDLAWTDNSSDEAGFKIERKTTGAFAQIATVGANVTAYANTGLTPNTAYTYRVRGYLGTAHSAYSNEAAATTPALPSAPSGLSATAVSSTRINLAWTDNSGDETGFKIERKTTGAFAQIASAGANITAYANTGLTANTLYTYRVRAYRGGDHSAYSNEASATTPVIPAAPTGLTAAAAGSGRINLAWSDNSGNETGFQIERKSGGSAFALLASVAANVTSYGNTGLAASMAYTYRVRATRGTDFSGYSNEATGTTLPAAPGSLTATAASSTQINLGWTDNSSDETGFELERKSGAGAYAVAANLAAGATAFADTGLTPNTSYTYRVRAVRNSAFSAYSNEATAKTLALPAAPSGLTAAAGGSTRIHLAWTDKSSDETGFQIERKSGGGSFALLANVSANVTSYANTGLAASTAYTYRVRAVRGSDLSAYSNEATATTPALPAAPSGLTATAAGSARINLAWTDNSDDEGGFQIERKSGGGAFALLATVGANATTHANTGLAANTSYTYRVRAYRGSDFSAYSNEAAATTLPLPTAPTGLTATAAGSTKINLKWTDNSSDETGFQIERKSGGAFALLATAGVNATTYANTGLAANTLYTYRVRAVRGTDVSAYSNEAAATTPALPAAPSGLTATAAGSTRINLAWTDNSGDESGFQVERKSSGGYSLIASVGAGVTSYANTGLTANTQYTYRVRAHRTGDLSAYSNEATASTLPLPKAPSALTARAVSAAQIDLAWHDNSGDETGFQIERKTGSTAYALRATVGRNVVKYSDTGLTPSTAYTYRVRAVRNADNSAYTSAASATTFAAPRAPSGLTAQAISKNQINLKWTDNSSDETGFRVERKIGSGAFQVLTILAANSTSVADIDLAANTVCTYRVCAIRGGDVSAYSNEATATTLR